MDANEHRVYYAGSLDTAGGQSGIAVWRRDGDERSISVVHTTGSETRNGGTRLDNDKLDRIISWISDDQSTQGNSDWFDGDWNHDREFDSGVLVTAFEASGYVSSARAALVDSLLADLRLSDDDNDRFRRRG